MSALGFVCGKRLPCPAVALLVLLAACTGETKNTDDTGEDTQGAAGNGLPEGASTWSGSMEVGPFPFLLNFELENTGGDLVAVATFEDDPNMPAGMGSATYRLTGTHDPVSGRLALAPDRWVGEDRSELELIGATATYDPATQTIRGMIVDYAAGGDNVLYGGEVSATLTSGDGAPTRVGDGGRALGKGSRSFAGTLQCTGAVRDVAGAFDYDGQGGMVGTMTIGDTTVDNPLGAFEFTGVHNSTTGGITLVPGLWQDPDHNTLTFFIDGTYDPGSGAFTGDQRTQINACPPGTWNVVVE